jgi:hypothetical protein
VLPQATHVPPVGPHAEIVGGIVHVVPEQQPTEQDVELQTHLPPEHCWPAAHAAPMPHAHAPEDEQLSAFVVSHEAHAAPPVPQLGNASALHTAPEQQPVAQDVELQTQAPAEHTWPAPHAADAPHLQVPAVQLSAVPAAHAMHAPPAVPHAPSEGVLHVSPEQQPIVHVEVHPLHAPLSHVSTPEQLWQADPPLPQAPGLLPSWQTLLVSQQPVGHEVPSQTHVPPRQRWPALQAAPVPQAQDPVDEHWSDATGSQLAQVFPAPPHAVTERGLHVAPAQHPLGQDVASHVQTDPAPQA